MTLHGSINCSTVICSPTVIFAILREASSEHYGPQGLLHTIFSALHFLLHCTFRLQISLLKTILKGLTTPLKRWVQACLFLRRYSGLDETLLLDRYLGSQTEGNTYFSCVASPFPLQGKNQRKPNLRQRVNLWRCCLGSSNRRMGTALTWTSIPLMINPSRKHPQLQKKN